MNFRTAWTHPTTPPTPQQVYAIILTEDSNRMYQTYLQVPPFSITNQVAYYYSVRAWKVSEIVLVKA